MFLGKSYLKLDGAEWFDRDFEFHYVLKVEWKMILLR